MKNSQEVELKITEDINNLIEDLDNVKKLYKKILDEYKTINWDTQKLNLDYLQSILPKGETYVVDKIYEFITELVNSNFENKFIERFNLILKQDYKKKEKSDFKIEGNGVEDIRKILINLIEGETNEI